MELIPAIDLRNGHCVRLFQGDFDQTTVYDADPVAVALRWQAAGATRIHVVDLDGAKAGKPTQTATIAAIVKAVQVPVQLGGGLRNAESVAQAFELGISDVILGTAAVRQPNLIAELVQQYGNAITVGIDARNGVVATEGWQASSRIRATELADQMSQLGVSRIIYTDISRDGTLTEPNYGQTAALVQPDGAQIIASGGISRIEHLQRLAEYGIAGAIIGTALYTGHIDLAQAIEIVHRR